MRVSRCGCRGGTFFHYYAANVDYVFASHRSTNNVFCEKATSRTGPSLEGWYSLSKLSLFLIVPPSFCFVLLTAYFWLYGQGLGFVLIEKTNEIFDLYITALKGQGQNINPSLSKQLDGVKKSFRYSPSSYFDFLDVVNSFKRSNCTIYALKDQTGIEDRVCDQRGSNF